MVQDVEKRNKSYNQYVENVTKKAGCIYNCFKAFITGGIICTIGQLIMNFMKMTGMTADDAASYTTLILVALSVIFTNSIASPAIEYKKEGQVFGIGCKIFTIAGPVILYGIFFSWIIGLIYWIISLM